MIALSLGSFSRRRCSSEGSLFADVVADQAYKAIVDEATVLSQPGPARTRFHERGMEGERLQELILTEAARRLSCRLCALALLFQICCL